MTDLKSPSGLQRTFLLTAVVSGLVLCASTEDANGATRNRPSSKHGSLERTVFYSPSLDVDEYYRIYLPPGYAKSGRKRYPVMYLLHGLGGTDRDFFVYGFLHDTLDRLITSGTIEPMIVVGANGGSSYWSNHIGSPESPGPRYRDYIVQDLIGTIDSRYRTRATGDQRAVAGVSMGGYGAMSVVLENPGDFRAAVSLSGALFPVAPTHRKVYLQVWGDPPNPAFFNETSPMWLMKQLPDGSKRPSLYFHCGDRDSLGFLKYALAAHEVLISRKIPHALRVTGGGHTWETWNAQSEDWLRWVDRKFRNK